MEQIVLNNPISGNYDITGKWLDCTILTIKNILFHIHLLDNVEITYPIGGEGLVLENILLLDGIMLIIIKTLLSNTLNNNGSSWNTISNNVSSDLNHYVWTIPNDINSSSKIRVSRGNTISESNDVFTIVDVPTNLSVFWPCPDSIYVSWNSVLKLIIL